MVRRRRTLFALLFILLILLLIGNIVPATEQKVEDIIKNNQRWTEERFDMFFDYSSEYAKYQFPVSDMVGVIIDEDKVIEVFIGRENGYFEFGAMHETGRGIIFLFSGYIQVLKDNYCEIKIEKSDYPMISCGTILTFTAQDISPDELYIPECLGDIREEWRHGDGSRPLKKSRKEAKSGKIEAYQSKEAGVRYASGRGTAAVILQQFVREDKDTGTVPLKTRGRFLCLGRKDHIDQHSS